MTIDDACDGRLFYFNFHLLLLSDWSGLSVICIISSEFNRLRELRSVNIRFIGSPRKAEDSNTSRMIG